MAWIKVDQTIRDNKKIFALADELDIDPSHAIGLLVSLWVWSVDNAPDGDMSDMSARTISRAAGWTGDKDALVDALVHAGLLDEGHIHDWNDYTGDMLRKKAADADKKREQYAAKKAQEARKETSESSADSPQSLRDFSAESPQILRGENEEKPERISESPLLDKDKDKDKDKDIDKDLKGEKESKKKKTANAVSGDKVPARTHKETQEEMYDRLATVFTPRTISDTLDHEIRLWLRYKTERKQPYKESGLAALLRKIVLDETVKHGEKKVCDLIEECMASNYSGIIWDKLDKPQGSYAGNRGRPTDIVEQMKDW